MGILMLLVAAVLSLSPVALGAPPKTTETIALARVTASQSQLPILQQHFDLTEHGHAGRYDVVLHPGDRAHLKRLGFKFDVVVPDLLALDASARSAELRAQAASPGDRVLYRTLADYEADLDALAARAPQIARAVVLPHATEQKRRVRAIEIAGPDVVAARKDGRPVAMIDGLHHAREWPSGELTMMFATELVDAYLAGDERVTSLLDEVRVIVVPVVNPDGFVRSRETVSDFVAPVPGVAAYASEFAYHRKNLRPSGQAGANGVELQQGVDVNRNYPFLWSGTGASGNPQSQTYFGPSPGSEPETRNVQSVLLENHVVAYISNHTYGNLVLRPWGHTEHDSPDELVLEQLGDAMARHNGYTSQKGIHLYPTTGTADDWHYAVTSGLGYTFEIGSPGFGVGNVTPVECAGFHPQYNLCIPRFYELNRGAYLELLEAARDESLHAVIAGTAPAGTTIRTTKVLRVPQDSGGPQAQVHRATITVGESGAYEFHVNPSPLRTTVEDVEAGWKPAVALETYTVTATLPDGRTQSAEILAQRGERYAFDFG